jgi:hypothetical protein
MRRTRIAAASVAMNEPAPGRVSTIPFQLQGGDRLAHRRAAHLEHARELSLGRQAAARLKRTAENLLTQPLRNLLVELRCADRTNHSFHARHLV